MRAVGEILRAYTEVVSSTGRRVGDQEVYTTLEAGRCSCCEARHDSTAGTLEGRMHFHRSMVRTHCWSMRLRQTLQRIEQNFRVEIVARLRTELWLRSPERLELVGNRNLQLGLGPGT